MTEIATVRVRSGDPAHLAAEFSLSEAAKEVLVSGTAVFLPFAHSKGKHQVFPSGTRELFRYLSERVPHEITVEVASSEEDYRELTERADLWVLPILFLAQPSAADVVLNLISNYLYDRLRTLLPGRTAEVTSEVIVATESSMISLNYKGPPESYEKVIRELLRKNPRE